MKYSLQYRHSFALHFILSFFSKAHLFELNSHYLSSNQVFKHSFYPKLTFEVKNSPPLLCKGFSKTHTFKCLHLSNCSLAQLQHKHLLL